MAPKIAYLEIAVAAASDVDNATFKCHSTFIPLKAALVALRGAAVLEW
jgi:hypothetical protein